MEAYFSNLLGFIKLFGIAGAIEVAIIALLIYKLLWSTRKYSFGRLLKGVAVVLALMAIAAMANFYAVSKLFNYVVEYGAIALVVVFQPEIRRVLERMGDTRLFHMMFDSSHRDLDSVETAIHQTVSAYQQMSEDKVGALMVFERANHLDEVIKTGTALDAAVSAELLKNIFWDKAPLHDGAVIVRNGKICEPVRGASLVGKGSDVIMNIDMVCTDLDMGQGMCGSSSGSVPTNVGQALIRVSSITVGGR